MANQFTIVFLGICSVVQMQIGTDPDARRIVLPRLNGTQVVANHPIPLHRGFIMFPAAAFDSSTGGWLKPPEIVVEGVRRGFYFLDGDEITLSHVTEPVDGATHAQSVFRLPKFCPNFVMADKFTTPVDPDVVVAHFDVTYGELRIKRKFAGMRATELTMHSDQPKLVISAKSYRYGTTRSVTVTAGAEVWIGNMTDSFFDPNVPRDPNHPHFLAYYLMSKEANTCDWVPSDPAPPLSRRGNVVRKDLGVTCSNSGYP